MSVEAAQRMKVRFLGEVPAEPKPQSDVLSDLQLQALRGELDHAHELNYPELLAKRAAKTLALHVCTLMAQASEGIGSMSEAEKAAFHARSGLGAKAKSIAQALEMMGQPAVRLALSCHDVLPATLSVMAATAGQFLVNDAVDAISRQAMVRFMLNSINDEAKRMAGSGGSPADSEAETAAVAALATVMRSSQCRHSELWEVLVDSVREWPRLLSEQRGNTLTALGAEPATLLAQIALAATRRGTSAPALSPIDVSGVLSQLPRLGEIQTGVLAEAVARAVSHPVPRYARHRVQLATNCGAILSSIHREKLGNFLPVRNLLSLAGASWGEVVVAGQIGLPMQLRDRIQADAGTPDRVKEVQEWATENGSIDQGHFETAIGALRQLGMRDHEVSAFVDATLTSIQDIPRKHADLLSWVVASPQLCFKQRLEAVERARPVPSQWRASLPELMFPVSVADLRDAYSGPKEPTVITQSMLLERALAQSGFMRLQEVSAVNRSDKFVLGILAQEPQRLAEFTEISDFKRYAALANIDVEIDEPPAAPRPRG